MSKKINKWLENIHKRLTGDELDLFTDETQIEFNNKKYRVIAYYQTDGCRLSIFDGNTKQINDTELEFFIEKNRTPVLKLFKYIRSER